MIYRLENRGGRFSWKRADPLDVIARVAIESLSIRSKTSDSATTSKDSIRWATEGWVSLIVATLS
jgi:hypothetical protein